MKILVFLGVLVAYTQATSEPISVQNRIKQAHLACIQEHGWDANEIKEQFKQDILPDNKDQVNDFVYCYWKKIGLIDANGVINELQIKILAPHIIRDRYPGTSENDAAESADHAVEECKKKVTIDANSIGKSCVHFRNCLMQYVVEKHN